jgi:hypothetical protein
MPTTLETFGLNMLQPIQRPEDARQDACKFAASLTITKGQAIGVATATGLGQQLVPGASDGTQNFVGFSMYDFLTDANGKVFFSDSTGATWRSTPWTTAPIWVKGIFDPADLKTKATPVAEVDTFTPGGTITAGDINKLTYTAPDGTVTVISFTVGGTTTAAAVSAGLIAAWNANATTAAVATATGSVTVVLTGVTAGTPFTVASSVTGVGTLTRAATTAASGRAIADVLVGCPGARVLHNGFWEIP